jgi:NitT/TauT family transport system permease protein
MAERDPRPLPPWIISVALFVVLMAAWQAYVRWYDIPAFLLPAPSDILSTLVFRMRTGVYTEHILVTLAEIVGGFAIAAVLGIAVGALIAQFQIVERVSYPYLVALQTMPKIAIAPLLIIWFGFGISAKIVIAAMVAFFPILVNVLTGLKTVDPKRLALLASLGATPWQTFVMLKLPNALPFVFAGFEVAIVFAVLGAIVGEFVGAASGLGSIIVVNQFSMDVAGVFSVLILLSALGISLHLMVRVIGRRLAFWSQAEQIVGA